MFEQELGIDVAQPNYLRSRKQNVLKLDQRDQVKPYKKRGETPPLTLLTGDALQAAIRAEAEETVRKTEKAAREEEKKERY